LVYVAGKAGFHPFIPGVLSGLGYTLYTYGSLIFLIWEEGLQEQKVKIGLFAFGIQLGLNVLWSFIFFGLKSPYYAFIEIILLWLAIFLTILKFREISKMASYLLLPYIM
jgi:tryptophan-rich sensory protein